MFVKLISSFLIILILNIGASNSYAGSQEALNPDVIVRIMAKVSSYELKAKPSNDWMGSPYYIGDLNLYDITGKKKYLNTIQQWAVKNNWDLPRTPIKSYKKSEQQKANDYCCGQVYCELYMLTPGVNNFYMIAKTKEDVDGMLVRPVKGHSVWYWSDALFMAPPVFVRLAYITGDKKYLDFMGNLWWDVYDDLFDQQEGLFYRDGRFIWPRAKTREGKKVFWSRGNGWVMAGLVRVLQYLPNDYPDRHRYEKLFQTMAVSISRTQGSDGLWRTSLLDAAEYPQPETSGSAFFCFAIAWGINNGLLDRQAYTPVVKKAWTGLVSKVDIWGKLGYVQSPADRPGVVSPEQTQPYAVGAFLLAGSEMYKLMGGK